MPFQIIRADITRLKVDAIVNAANPSLLGGGGVDGAIHRAAGPQLLVECKTLHGCETGEAKITKGYELPAKYVIHTVGPIWGTEGGKEESLLRSCYRTSLALAAKYKCTSVAFPLISAGAYGCPKEIAVRIAVEEIGRFVLDNEMDVTLTIFDTLSYKVAGHWFKDLAAFIDDHYVEGFEKLQASRNLFSEAGRFPSIQANKAFQAEKAAAYQPMEAEETAADSAFEAEGMPARRPMEAEKMAAGSAFHEKKMPSLPLSQQLLQLDESFSVRLLKLIDEKGMTDAQCYKKANIDRKLFSKIRNHKNYRPSKSTALAFCVALELSVEETKAFLASAGFALSRSSKQDVIVEYFISNGRYNIFEINEALFTYDQGLLGG